MNSNLMWTIKASMTEKNKKRKLSHDSKPTRTELIGNESKLTRFCFDNKLSDSTKQRLIEGVPDKRDLRTVPPNERVPRYLEKSEDTPPRYWDIDI